MDTGELKRKIEALLHEWAGRLPGKEELAAALEPLLPEIVEANMVSLLEDPEAPSRDRVGAAGHLCRVKGVSPAALEILVGALAEPDPVGQEARSSLLVDVLPLAPAALARVLERLRDPSPVARRNAIWVLGLLDWEDHPPEEANQIVPAVLAALDDPDASVRREAADALFRCPHRKREETAVPGLIRLAGDPDSSMRKDAMKALGSVADEGADVIHALAAGLQDADPAARVEAALAFVYRSRHTDPAIKAVFAEALAVTDPAVRARALEGLWHVDWRDPASLVIFVEHLKDPDPHVRDMAALQIMNVGWNDPEIAKPAVPALIEALGRGVHHAPGALVKIAPDEPALRAFLVEALGRDREKLDSAALLLEIGAEVDAALDVLLGELRTPRVPWHLRRNQAAEALLEHAPPLAGLAAELRDLLDDPDPVFRTQVALIIARLDREDDRALEIVAAGLRHGEKRVRRTTLYGLRHVAKRNDRVLELLVGALADPAEDTRSFVFSVLEEMNVSSASVPLLIACLRKNDQDLDRHALRLLGSLGQEAREAEPAVLEVLGGPDESMRAPALSALAMIGPVDPSSVPPLLEALRSGDSTLRAWALLGLQKLGPIAAPATRAVSEALGDSDPAMRLRAALALVAITGSGGAALPVLEEMARHENKRLRVPAAETLAALRGRAS